VIRWLLAIALLLCPQFLNAAEIAHSFTEQNTAQTTTSGTFADVTGADIADTEFTADDKYLIYITAQAGESSSGRNDLQVMHGSTAFAASLGNINQWSVLHYGVYNYMVVWTAVDMEDINIQMKATAGTASLDHISLLAINLSNDVTENTDWFSATRADDDSLSTTPTDGASITFTPTAGHDWLVLTNSILDLDSTTTSGVTRIERSGEASSSTPEARMESNVTTSRNTFALANVYNLGASSNTFKEVSESTGTTHTRMDSTIFAIDMDKFRNHAFTYTDADTSALSTTNYATEIQTVDITPDVQGPVWIGAYWGCDTGSAGSRECEWRIQDDGTDQPAGQTDDNLQGGYGMNDTTDEMPFTLSTLVAAMPASTSTIDMDASTDAGTTATAQHRLLWAMSMELPAVGGRRRIAAFIF